MLKRQNSIKYVLAVSLMAALWGCATQPHAPTKAPQQLSSTSLQSASQSPTAYLDAASKASNGEVRQRNLLLAAHAYINTNQLKAADEILLSLKGALTQPELQAEQRYLRALVLEHKGMLADALEQLDYQRSWALQDWQWINYYQLRATLYAKTKRPVQQVRELCFLSQYLPEQEAQVQNQQIWSLLNALQEETLEYYVQYDSKRAGNDKSEAIYLGWLKLAYLAKHYAVDPSSLVSQLGRWQSANPSHPAAMQLPQDLQQALNTKPYHPQRIAVLLPLSGERTNVAEPLKNGITAAYLEEPETEVELQFYDTATGAANAYQAALTAGADFVIGPLLQDNVQQVISYKTTHQQGVAGQTTLPPQLFLNNADVMNSSKDEFYFALSPVQEAVDAAQRLYQDGIEQPLLMASNDAVGHRMAESFNLNWQQLTDKPAEIHYYDNDKMRDTVQEALNVSASEARISAVKKLLGNKIKADFRSRRDIDAIYMICSAHDLTLLKPFIDVNFSVFAEPAKLYTSSRARQDDSQQTVQELNKITISDIPWLMRHNSSNVATLWPSWGNPQKRLFAMGSDSLRLVNKLAQMRAFPSYQLNGYTGLLSVSQDGVINRQLKWGRYSHGVLKAN